MNEKLVKIVREKLDCKSNAETERTISTVLNSVMEVLKEEENLRCNGGTFKIVSRAERKGRNPRTREEIVIPAKKSVTFKLSKIVSEELNHK